MCESKKKWIENRLPKLKHLLSVLEIMFFTMLPVITGLILAVLDDDNNPASGDVVKRIYKGEFLLYSISFLSSAYITYGLYSKSRSVIVVFLLLTSISYSLSTTVEQLNHIAIIIMSIFAVLVGVVYIWKSYGIQRDNCINPQKILHDSQEEIEIALNKQ
ncbi:MAG: hypothetical protein K6F69_07365 [Treponema sp.]|nr:hypothetical protein [Treponema sp.]